MGEKALSSFAKQRFRNEIRVAVIVGDPDDQPPFAIHQTHWRSTSFDAVWKVQQITRSRPDQPLLSAFEEKYRVVLYFGSSCCARSSMDRASVFGTEGWGFDSLRVRSKTPFLAGFSVDGTLMA